MPTIFNIELTVNNVFGKVLKRENLTNRQPRPKKIQNKSDKEI